MGKARIVSSAGEGNYTVEVLHNRERIEAEIEEITADLVTLDEQKTEAKESLDLRQLELEEVTIYVNALIDQWGEELELPPVDLALLVTLHNSTRTSRGLGALTAVAALNTAAQLHANWLAENDTTGHTGAGGSTPKIRAASAGYAGGVGENIVSGLKPPESAALNAWMLSPAHKANILNPVWEHIGLGYACKPDGNRRHWWVAVFGVGGAASAQTPAAPSNCIDKEDDLPELLREAMEDLAKAAMERDKAQVAYTSIAARVLALELRKKALEDIPDDPIQQAWCADYTENLAGEVASIEIPGEGNKRLIVRPGYSGSAVYNSVRDGELFHRHGMISYQAFFNAAILPGWQKWLPTYRVGALTAVDTDTDTGSVSLDAETSSADQLGINRETNLVGIPIQYMDCNADVFEPGDRVVVEFPDRDWINARVIGFESQPKECIPWPREVLVEVFRNALPDDQILTTFGDPNQIIRDIRNTHGCCGWQSITNTALTMRKFSLSYGGPGSVVFNDEEGDPIASGFSLAIEAIEDGLTAIDELWGTSTTGDQRIGYYNERGQEVAEISSVSISTGFGTTTAGLPAISWRVRKATGYAELTLPPRNNCAGAAATGWVGTNDAFATNTAGSITSIRAECQGVVAVPVVDVELTRILEGSGTNDPTYPHITAFAVAQGAIADHLIVNSEGGSEKTYMADGFVSTASSLFSSTRVWMKFTREDLMPE